MSLKDKTIVVTGGSRGLGLGLVEALVDQARAQHLHVDAHAIHIRQSHGQIGQCRRASRQHDPIIVIHGSASHRSYPDFRFGLLLRALGNQPLHHRADLGADAIFVQGAKLFGVERIQ